MTRRTGLWLRLASLLVAGVLAALLRLRAVELLPIDYDEDDYLRSAQQVATALQAGDWQALTELNYRPEHPPLAKIVYGLALWPLPAADEIPDRPVTAQPAASLPQPHLLVARLAAAAASTLQVLVVAAVSPLAGLFLAAHTFTIKYSSQVMLEALPALMSTVAVVAYARSRRRWNGWTFLSAAALGLTAASKYLYAVAGLAIALHWLWETRPAGRSLAALMRWLAPVALWGGLALACFLASNPYLWPAPVARLRESVAYHSQYAQSEGVQRANLPAWQPLVWAFTSVPWHPGVFLIGIDGLFAVLAIAGLKRLWQRQRIYVVWLAVGLLFLFLWPTKWPQYIVMLTAPLTLAAAAGFEGVVWQPLWAWVRRAQAQGWRRRHPVGEGWRWRHAGRAVPWLLPGLVVLLLITFYPLLYQAGMSLTDFSAMSIKDGINGGIWREVGEGLRGEAEPVEVNVFDFGRPTSKEVHYVGLAPLLQFLGSGFELLVFEALWTLLAVGLQTGVGVGVAWLLHQRGLRFGTWWRTIFILPWAIPEFVGALIWLQIFDPRYGWFFLGTSFPESPGFALAEQLSTWQENPNAALLVLLVASTWLGFPLIMLAASAGLKMIPHEAYDAAAIDGAGGWQQFRSITWPLLLPLLAPALIIRGILAFNQFYLFYALNAPWPVMTFASLSYWVFHFSGRYAISAVVNVFTVMLLVLFLLWFNRVSRAGEGVTYA